MMKKSKMIRFLGLGALLIGLLLIDGNLTEALAQSTRDPFARPAYARPRPERQDTRNNTNTSNSPDSTPQVEKPKGPVVVAPPSIDQRIDYYKQMREHAALNGLPIPKVTSVLTLDEMSVTGIFRTPRGYAAMVEARPIQLSYTIYPGEKFFDGQLVAVEENRLVFRKVTKMSNNRFVSTVENKTLRQYTVQEEVQGTAPVGSSSGRVEAASNTRPAEIVVPAAPAVIISPLDEMNNQPKEEPKDSADKGKKTNTRVARGRRRP